MVYDKSEPKVDIEQHVSLKRYQETIARVAKMQFPHLSNNDINKAINYSMNKRYKSEPCTIDNNYSNKKVNMDLVGVTDYIIEKEPIITNWGVLWKRKGTVPNPLVDMVRMFMENRNIHKKEMFKYPKGSEDFEAYNMLQLLDKIDCNAIYGCLGMFSCMYYNINVAASITSQGRALVSSAGMCFEQFLSNNVKFGSLDEVITFIDNVVNERKERKFKDSDILDRNITVEECFEKIVFTCGFQWIPTEDDLNILWDIFNKLDQETINRLYYKNNLFNFIANSKMMTMIDKLLATMNTPYLNPNKCPDEIVEELEAFSDIVLEYVYYHHMIIDSVNRMDNMKKNVVVLSDTDSNIICLDEWYRFILDNVAKGKKYKITYETLNAMSYLEGDGKVKPKDIVTFEEPKLDYDFYNDKITEQKRAANLIDIIPQDNLRYSIINILAFMLDKVINDYMERFCKITNSYVPGEDKCNIIMKNEFLFKRVLLTMVKKNYASIQELQEGNIVPFDKALDLKGLAIDKSSMNKDTRRELKQVLFEDILNADNIDQVNIIKHLAILENNIYKSLASGQKSYYKPLTIKPFSSYDKPFGIQGIKATIVWNHVMASSFNTIDLTERNGIDIVKVAITPNNIDRIKDTFPEEYALISEIIGTTTEPSPNNTFKDAYKGLIKAVAIPKNSTTPEWILPFIDYATIINDNLGNFPLESVGCERMGKDKVNYTNIVKL